MFPSTPRVSPLGICPYQNSFHVVGLGVQEYNGWFTRYIGVLTFMCNGFVHPDECCDCGAVVVGSENYSEGVE